MIKQHWPLSKPMLTWFTSAYALNRPGRFHGSILLCMQHFIGNMFTARALSYSLALSMFATVFNPSTLRPKGYCRFRRLSICPSVRLSECMTKHWKNIFSNIFETWLEYSLGEYIGQVR